MEFLHETLKAGSLHLTNRLVMPPMATAKAGKDGMVSPEILDYYGEKSKGGYIGLIIIEHSFISKQGKASKGQLSISDDNVIADLKKLATVIHQNGSKCIMQINHAGSVAEKEVTGTIPVGPSAINPRKMEEEKDIQVLTVQDIQEIITQFQNAARRVKEAGFDGVEIHSAHGYLLNQFFSPLSNKRSDSYGGTLINRIRIHLEIIKAVRDVVGMDFPILLRLGASDYIEGGTDINDSLTASKEFEKAGIDILDISGGLLGFGMPDDTIEQGYFSPLTEVIKKAISIPVILTGGIKHAETAELFLANGKADLIGVGRAILGDSGWAKRAIEGA